MLRILITGSRGFLGGSLGRLWASGGHEILGVGRSSQPEADWPGAHAHADVAHQELSSLVGDFNPDVVFHGAGTASVGGSFDAPLQDFRAQSLTWATALESVRRSRRRPVVLLPSSAAVYGNPAQLPVAETASLQAISPYGHHKICCEALAAEYAQCFGLMIAVCRLFSTFGPRQRRLLVWEIYEQVAGSAPEVVLEGTGEESRDYLAIEDVASALLGVTDWCRAQGDSGQCLTVNVASGEETRVVTLASAIRDRLAVDKPIRFHGRARAGDPERWCADVSRLGSIAPAWRPTPLLTGLERCVDAWRR
jgi:nucleoside-diphosphate-sugar epimerase